MENHTLRAFFLDTTARSSIAGRNRESTGKFKGRRGEVKPPGAQHDWFPGSVSLISTFRRHAIRAGENWLSVPEVEKGLYAIHLWFKIVIRYSDTFMKRVQLSWNGEWPDLLPSTHRCGCRPIPVVSWRPCPCTRSWH